MQASPTLVDRCLWRLGILDPQSPNRVNRPMLTAVVAFHLLALLACFPWFFSWSGLGVALAGLYLYGGLGVCVGYHRLLTHRSFACSRWLEHALSVLGLCSWQGSPMSWVAVHRMHHQHSDEHSDPHTPRRSFFWSHMGWFLIIDPAIYNFDTYYHYARDLFRDPFYKRLERPNIRRNILAAMWAAYLLAGGLLGFLTTGTVWGALQIGLSWLVWGILVRTVAVWHITWSVNSFTHLWGYRNFDTDDDSRNNWLVSYFFAQNGEGWHNNHHADPRSAAHGQRWWELDVYYLFICALERVGLAWDVIRPRGQKQLAVDPPEQRRAAA
jgi:stearoyl-CoA desaturase (delta-9 desaturase)